MNLSKIFGVVTNLTEQERYKWRSLKNPAHAYVKLFDLIVDLEDADEVSLRMRKTKSQIRSISHHLFKSILSEFSNDTVIGKIERLTRIGYKQDARQLGSETIDYYMAREQFGLAFELIDSTKRLIPNIVPQSTLNHITIGLEELCQLSRLRSLLQKIFEQHESNRAQLLIETVKHYPILADPDNLHSKRAAIQAHRILQIAHDWSRNYNSGLIHSKRIMAIQEQTYSNPLEKIETLKIIALQLQVLERDSEARIYLSKLLAISVESTHEIAKKWIEFIRAFIPIAVSSGWNDHPFLADFEMKWESYSDRLRPDTSELLKYSYGVYLYQQGRFAECQRWLMKNPQYRGKSERLMIQANLAFLRCFVLLENGSRGVDGLESNQQLLYNKVAEVNEYRVYGVVLTLLKALTTKPNIEHKTLYLSALAEIQPLKITEPRAFQYFNWTAWISSKYIGCTMNEVIQAHSTSESLKAN